MRHPNEAALALHAGGDLSFFARWRMERHLARCSQCRDEVAAFSDFREMLPGLAEPPDLPWNRMAAEMRANIRLGLSAGDCVRPAERPLREHPLFTGFRAAVAMAGMAALVVTGLMLERPSPVLTSEGRVVESTVNGIQIRDGAGTFRLMNPSADAVTYTVGAGGSVSARSVDSDGDGVTINKVYAE
jgi:anti-sigma factor RsiW